MARAVRKSEKIVPRKRLISEAPPLPYRDERFVAEGTALVLVALGLFLALALWSFLQIPAYWDVVLKGSVLELSGPSANVMGPLGAHLAKVLLRLLGLCSFVTVLWAFLLARTVWKTAPKKRHYPFLVPVIAMISSVMLAVSAASVAATIWGYKGGGSIGTAIAFRLVSYVNEAGTLLVCGVVFLISLAAATGLYSSKLLEWVISIFSSSSTLLAESGRVGSKISLGAAKTAGSAALASGKFLAKPFLVEKQATEERFSEFDGKFSLGENLPAVEDRSSEIPEFPEFELIPIRPEVSSTTEEDEEDGEVEEKNEPPSNFAKRVLGIKKRRVLRTRAPKNSDAEDPFELPSLELLVSGDSSSRVQPKQRELKENSKRLEETLQHFRIGGRVVDVHPGPVITLYEFEPAPGVKVQRIITLADDLALALRVASVRVYAPVPGKASVGIEVPNSEREIVRLRDLLEHKDYWDSQVPLALALGKDTFGEPYITDLSKMPHLLIAGATGTGKSVCINSLLLSLLHKNRPTDLRLIMIDPKMLELSVYEGIPHLYAPVVTQAKRARGVLWWAVEEMERRYELMKELGVRNLASYNASVDNASAGSREGRVSDVPKAEVIELREQDVIATRNEMPMLDRELSVEKSAAELSDKFGEKLPRIVIVVDELADLMLTVGREIEELLTRLAQKARAAGIHLILATQRPSVNVITGLIKANFPSRISFKVASRIDARTVLDNSGAEKLLGQGDMLFLAPGAGRPKRLHSPFVSDKEVHDVVDALRKQGEPQYDAKIESMIERFENSENSVGGEESTEEYDPLYDQAVNLVVEKGMASTSMVQRVFRIGYNRAARILETMERDGVVGPADGAKPRQILVPNRSADY